jgi:hypothetical protein
MAQKHRHDHVEGDWEDFANPVSAEWMETKRTLNSDRRITNSGYIGFVNLLLSEVAQCDCYTCEDVLALYV